MGAHKKKLWMSKSVADPGSDVLLPPGSGIIFFRIRDEFFLLLAPETIRSKKNVVFISSPFLFRIRDEKMFGSASGLENVRIRDRKMCESGIKTSRIRNTVVS
jgi:hypothetical protein